MTADNSTLLTAADNIPPPTFTWPHLKYDVSLEEGEY